MTDDIVFTEEDARLLFGNLPISQQGSVYYDERTGVITGLSQTEDNDLAGRFPRIAIDLDVVNAFLNGEKRISDWMVVYQGETPALVRTNIKSITVKELDTNWVIASGDPAPVRIVLVVPPEDLTGLVICNVTEGVEVEAGFSEPIRLRLVRRGMPEAVIVDIEIDPQELFSTGEQEVSFPELIDYPIDLITRPLSSTSFLVQPYAEASRPLALPNGRFEDMIPLQRVTDADDPKSGMVVEVASDRLIVSLQGSGGRYYDRNLNAIMIALCEGNDKEAMFFRTRVSIEELRNAPVEIECDIPDGDILVLSQLYYERSYSIDKRVIADARSREMPLGVDLVTAAPYRGQTECLLFTVNGRESTLTASLLNGGGETYDREEYPPLVAHLVSGEAREMVYQSIPIDLSTGSQTYTVEAPKGYVILTPRIYLDTCWTPVQYRAADTRTDRIGDMVWAEHLSRNQASEVTGLALWVDHRKKMLRVQALSDMASREGMLKLVLCSSRDPETIICSFDAEISRLERGDMLGFPLPLAYHPELLADKFEILVQSLYSGAFIFE